MNALWTSFEYTLLNNIFYNEKIRMGVTWEDGETY